MNRAKEKIIGLYDSLESNLCVVTHINSLFHDGIQDNNNWKEFRNAWNDLEQDEYMNDNGDYRMRRFCKLKYVGDNNTLWMKEYDHYYQDIKINPLNGGLKRWFSPMKLETFNNTIFNLLIKEVCQKITELTDQVDWDINVYLNRIIAKDNKLGKPSPEGIHKDGVKYSLLLLIDRVNIEGGENTIYDLDKKPILSHTLMKEGECIIFSDHATFHYASPIVQVDNSKLGYRDLLVVEFY